MQCREHRVRVKSRYRREEFKQCAERKAYFLREQVFYIQSFLRLRPESSHVAEFLGEHSLLSWCTLFIVSPWPDIIDERKFGNLHIVLGGLIFLAVMLL